MSKLRVLSLLVSLALSKAAGQLSPGEINIMHEVATGAILLEPGSARYDTLTAQEKAEVLLTIRAQKESASKEVRLRAWRSLIALEDEQAVIDFVKAERDDQHDFEEAGIGFDALPAMMLPYYIDDIYNGSAKLTPEERLAADNAGRAQLSIRDRAVFSALGIIEGWKEFPAETRQWALCVRSIATTANETIGLPIAADQFKAWWEHNKAPVLAKDYAKATWLPSEAPPALAEIWQPPRPAANQTPTAPATSPTNPPPVFPTPTPVSSASTSALKWLLVAAATLAALGLGWRALRRK